MSRRPELVLVPGWAMPARVLAPFAAGLARDWRVRLLDLPGQGDHRACVPAEQVLPALLAQAPRDAVWCGWSLGGQLALAAAAAQPRVRGVLAVAAGPRFCRGDDWPFGVAATEVLAMREGLARDPRAVVQNFLRLLASSGEDARAAVRALRGEVLACLSESASLEVGLELLLALDLREELRQLTTPCAWAAGDQDPLLDFAAVERAAAAMPTARLTRLEGAGHVPFASHAPQLVEALAQLRTEVFDQ